MTGIYIQMERAQHEKVQRILDLIEQNNRRETELAEHAHRPSLYESVVEKRERVAKYEAICHRLIRYYNAEKAKLNRIKSQA